MPEGDAVFLTAKRLRPALAGKTLTRSDFRVPRYATLDLRGQRVESVGTYGKHLFIRTAEVSIHTHLKMEGSWRVYAPGQRWTKPGFTARVVLARCLSRAPLPPCRVELQDPGSALARRAPGRQPQEAAKAR